MEEPGRFSPFAGMTRIRFKGFGLSPSQPRFGTPLEQHQCGPPDPGCQQGPTARPLFAATLAGRCKTEALEDLADLSLRRYPHDVLLARVWALRDNLTAYDAVYVVLAEALGAPLLTRDRRLANAAGPRARVEVV